jgi:hypothetical protein
MRAKRKSIPPKSTTTTLRAVFKNKVAKGVSIRRNG